MSLLPFPADSAEYDEYVSVMESMADEADSIPDPEPEDFGGRCEDAPCCGCCGNDRFDSCNEYEREQREADEYDAPEPDDAPDDSHLDGDWQDYEDEGGEDRYLDSYWEDQSEYGMDGCCGDF